jgi:UDP-N-acetylmuramoylalanine--D-glutamate ligase
MELAFASGKRYGVVGLGKSGRATVESLLASGAQVVAWDDGEKARVACQKEFPALTLAPVDQWDYPALTSVVMSPGIMLNHDAVKRANGQGVEVIGDIELLYRACPDATYVAITGTNGKSTTTSLIGHILTACAKRVEMGGNLGVAALSLAPLGPEGIYVLELSSYQLELLRTTRFQTAVWLNISPDHLDHHGSMENYVAAKEHIFDRQTPQDVAIMGVDDATSEALARLMLAAKKQRVIPVSVTQKVGNGVEVEHATLRARAFGNDSADLSPMRALQGEHNWQNAAAAYAACAVNGCVHADIIAAMQTYPGLPHRMQWLGVINGVTYVNDSKATNADAAEKALKTYDNIHWILGGVAKEGGIESLTRYFPKIRHAYLIGEAAPDFAKTLEGHVPYTHCGTLDKAFEAATKAAMGEGLKSASMCSVVLAPACASFDQFANFEVRGAAFIALTDALKTAGSAHATASR